MLKKPSFVIGVLAGLVLGAVWYAGCSHQRTASDSGSAAATTPARLLPHPAFAYAASNAKGVSIADIAERSLQAVVNISSTKVLHQRGRPMSPFFNDPFFRRFFGHRFPPHGGLPRERREKSLGSGVIVSKEGVVLTNNHVVEHAETITVALSDEREFSAKIVGTDPKSDLAVLQLQGEVKDLKPLSFGDSNRLRLGDVVIAIGNPFGVGQTVTMGIVSAKGRADMGIVDYEDFIQTDAAINPGNSGGALINMEGKLVGINTAILSRSGGYQGIGFAIPANMARPIMESLRKHGKVIRGWLGVAIQELKPEMARALKVDATRGVLISDVTAGSPADKAGLERGDVVLAINGERVSSSARLRNLVAAAGAGVTVKLELLRGEEQLELQVRLGEMPVTAGGVATLDQDEGVLGGLTVVGLSEASRDKYEVPKRIPHGVVVKEVARGSNADRAGIRSGDVILEINRRPIKDVEQFATLYKRAKGRLLLLVYRNGSTLYLLLSK
jgi:serine protease Do